MSKSIRDAYGEALVTYGKEDARIVVLDADDASHSDEASQARTLWPRPRSR